jgi:hypothetical protein
MPTEYDIAVAARSLAERLVRLENNPGGSLVRVSVCGLPASPWNRPEAHHGLIDSLRSGCIADLTAFIAHAYAAGHQAGAQLQKEADNRACEYSADGLAGFAVIEAVKAEPIVSLPMPTQNAASFIHATVE